VEYTNSIFVLAFTAGLFCLISGIEMSVADARKKLNKRNYMRAYRANKSVKSVKIKAKSVKKDILVNDFNGESFKIKRIALA